MTHCSVKEYVLFDGVFLELQCHVLHAFIFSIDASHTERIAKYINDSPKRYANCMPKAILVSGKPRLLIVALCDIGIGIELRYEYCGCVPWRQVTFIFTESIHFCGLIDQR